MPTPKGLVPVTDADRDAAAALYESWFPTHATTYNVMREGGPLDDMHWVQAFARHRADALTEALQVVREARLQLEYLDERFATGTTPAVIARLTAFIAQHEGEAKPQRCFMCEKAATTEYDGDRLCEDCAAYCARRDFEESDMPGGF